MTSACGLCGRERIDEIEHRGIQSIDSNLTVSHDIITSLPDRLREAQGLFDSTGGLHAAGLFDPSGELLAIREDVGRHNAVDKVIGWAFLEERLPLSDTILMISGRGSFEIVQKAVVAGIPIVCAVSAPSSLAVDLARRFDQTLIGFLRGPRFNIYSFAKRIELSAAERP
jgi:FdhD protein